MPKSETDSDSVGDEIQQLRADLGRLAETLQGLMRKRGGAALDEAGQAAGKAWHEARQGVDGVLRGIENRPITAALNAFCIGMMLGMMFGGRRG